MLCQLSTIKQRLSVLDTDTTYDSLLTTAITAISARFDKETNRTLARTENATDEFDPADTELAVSCYPIETVTKFEVKTCEATGWQDLTPAPDFLIRHRCIISLASPFRTPHSALRISYAPHSALRICYTGGYVLPGTTPADGQTPLPADIEHACIEQVVFWFTNREKLGLKTYWPKDIAYQQFATQDLLPAVAAVLKLHQRWSM